MPMSFVNPMDQIKRWDDQGQRNTTKQAFPLHEKLPTPLRSPHRRAYVGKTHINQPRAISEDTRTPLYKRAAPADIQAARDIVRRAKSESSKLNKARLANPLRNKYGLKPGTIISGGRNSNNRIATVKENVPPLLVISDEIAAAAALVAEADSIHESKNITKRAVKGSYWMER